MWYYRRLYHCLPQDFEKTIGKLKKLILGVPDNHLDQLRALPSTENINEGILITIMLCALNTDNDVFEFCDIMITMSDEIALKNLIDALFNGELTSDISS